MSEFLASNSDGRAAHIPVLYEEALAAVAGSGDDVVIDCTFGRGGHSQGLLNGLGPNGRVFALDRDPAAVSVGQALAARDARFAIKHRPFSELSEALEEWQLDQVDAVLFDLGVSSPQVDEAERGFSFMHDGPLDMRMDPTSGASAAHWIADIAEADLSRTFKDLGEERFARRIARAIVRRRAETAFSTTGDLAAVIAAAMPRKEYGKHPATRCFQALRIAVNGELDELHAGLAQAMKALMAGGRLVAISFHSLEDRVVKNFLRDQHLGPELPRGLPPPLDWPTPPLAKVYKAQRAKDAEIARNPRARSAMLRHAVMRP
jgi:16S rRNA (cytosine1402-N4)-methyltransferase